MEFKLFCTAVTLPVVAFSLSSSTIASPTVVEDIFPVGVSGIVACCAGTKYPGIMLSPYLHIHA